MGRIAFIGLGNMGGPMAKNLLEAGHAVSGFDTSQATLDRLGEAGGQAAQSLAAAVEGAETVITMLPAGEHVSKVYTGEAGVLTAAAPGTLLIDCSTIDVATARKVADAARTNGFAMLDAPVSGGVAGAEAGTLTFMVGGPQEALAKAEPLLSVMGKAIVHAGEAGAGQAAKICNNMILGVSMIAVSEAFNLADALGLDRQKLFDISSAASGQCWSLTTYCPVPGPVPSSPANRDYRPGFTAAMMLKDLKLAADAAASSQVATPLGDAAGALYQEFCGAGGDPVDFSGVIRHLRERSRDPREGG